MPCCSPSRRASSSCGAPRRDSTDVEDQADARNQRQPPEPLGECFVAVNLAVSAVNGDPDRTNEKAANGLFQQGKQVFRFDTFGDEAFWGPRGSRATSSST